MDDAIESRLRSDALTWAADHHWSPKTLREHLCVQQLFAPDEGTRQAIQHLINILDEHRPLGPNGKHDERHTATCGCDGRDGKT